MSASTQREKTIKELFVGSCWEYLRDNFHKFSDTNKIKIAMELCKKDMPQEINGSLTHVVQMPSIEKGGMKLEFNIG